LYFNHNSIPITNNNIDTPSSLHVKVYWNFDFFLGEIEQLWNWVFYLMHCMCLCFCVCQFLQSGLRTPQCTLQGTLTKPQDPVLIKVSGLIWIISKLNSMICNQLVLG
jgi:hypothetical protein